MEADQNPAAPQSSEEEVVRRLRELAELLSLELSVFCEEDDFIAFDPEFVLQIKQIMGREAADLIEALLQRQHLSNLNYDALEKQNTRLTAENAAARDHVSAVDEENHNLRTALKDKYRPDMQALLQAQAKNAALLKLLRRVRWTDDGSWGRDLVREIDAAIKDQP